MAGMPITRIIEQTTDQNSGFCKRPTSTRPEPLGVPQHGERDRRRGHRDQGRQDGDGQNRVVRPEVQQAAGGGLKGRTSMTLLLRDAVCDAKRPPEVLMQSGRIIASDRSRPSNDVSKAQTANLA